MFVLDSRYWWWNHYVWLFPHVDDNFNIKKLPTTAQINHQCLKDVFIMVHEPSPTSVINIKVCGYCWRLQTTLDQSLLCNKTWLTIWTLLKLLRQSNFESGIQRQNSAKTVQVKSVNSCLQKSFWLTRKQNDNFGELIIGECISLVSIQNYCFECASQIIRKRRIHKTLKLINWRYMIDDLNTVGSNKNHQDEK